MISIPSIRIVRQPKLELNDGSVVIPDFEIQFTLVFEEGRYLVECQNRKRSRAEIAHKIRYIKNLSSRNRFIFVYGTNLPEATRRVLDADGVVVMSFEEFASFVARLDAQVRLQEAEEQIHFDKMFRKYFRGDRGPGSFRPPTS